ncbi:MAG: hypothetical protein SFZ24_02000 [Planctomycetota bacterium]|nr:hypothetical protein [Planctomycetota bacterium]
MSGPSSLDLLKRLGAGVRPDPAVPAAARPAVESAGFSSLLEQARAGDFDSGRALGVEPGIKVKLSSEQLERLAAVADAAEAAGASRMLAVIDGQPVGIDVNNRTIIAGPDQLGSRMLTDFDAVVMVPDAPPRGVREALAGRARPARPEDPFAALQKPGNGSVAALLASLDQRRRTDQPTDAASNQE